MNTGSSYITDGGVFTSQISQKYNPRYMSRGRGKNWGEAAGRKSSFLGAGSLLYYHRLYIGVWGDSLLNVIGSDVVKVADFSMGYESSGEAIVSGASYQLDVANVLNIVILDDNNVR
ncbi:hypothetical protein OM280_18155 [Escherichia albertii]|nr:hypothetical protein [Escherichia albertii]